MIRNFFVTSIRSLKKNPTYSIINLLGLATGICATVFILIYVVHEFSYDKQFQNSERKYRLIRNFNRDTGTRDVGITSGPFADALLTDFPGRIKSTLRVMESSSLVSYGEESFMESNVYFADSTFFEFFEIPLIKGSYENALIGESVLVSSEMATKYFGDEDPINKILKIGNQSLYTVTGVFDKSQIQSHLDFDILASLHYQKSFRWFNDWWSNSFATYFMLEDGINVSEVTNNLPEFTGKYFADDWQRGVGLGLSLKAENLGDIYFNNEITFDFVQHGNKKVVYLFIVVAILVLMIAIFNFVNLSTALSVSRHTEIGIRKASGAIRSHIMLQFLLESVLLSFVATIFSFLLVEILYSWFVFVVGKPIPNPLTTPLLILLALSISIIVGILGGLYPALVLSSYSPKKALINKKGSGPRGQLLRRGMVILQFSFSLFLIFATWISWDQLQFIQSKNLGFDQENVLYFPISRSDIYSMRYSFKERVLNQSGIESMTFASGEPGGFHDFNAYEVEGKEGNISMRSAITDFDYAKTLELKFIEGRGFSAEYRTDSLEAVIINREAANYLGWELDEAIGKTIQNVFRDQVPRRVIGVVENYHFRSLHEKIDPLVISFGTDHRVAIVRFTSNDLESLHNSLEAEWKSIAPEYPYSHNFLDDQIERLYNNERSQSRLFVIFGSLAIFIACMGLFALSMISASKRTKEMAIRKVHGANAFQIVGILNLEFLSLVLVGLVLMIPFGWYIMTEWLQNFEYRIEVSFVYFLGTAILVTIISILTVSHKAISLSRVNPARALRHE